MNYNYRVEIKRTSAQIDEHPIFNPQKPRAGRSRRYRHILILLTQEVVVTRGAQPTTSADTNQNERARKKGILNEEYADVPRKTFDLRQKSDYEIYTELDEELVRETVNNAEKFIEKVKELLKTTY